MKKKILFRVGALEGGGAEKVLITILESLDRNKFDITLLSHMKAGVYISKIPKDIKLYYLGLGADHIQVPKFIKPIVKKIEKKKMKYLRAHVNHIYRRILPFRYDVEIAFLHDIIPYLKESPSKKKIGWVHNDLRLESYLKLALKNAIIESANQFDEIICVSNEALKGFVEIGGSPSIPKVIYNPIDVQEIKRKAKIDKQLFDNSKINILAIGRLVKQKRFDRLIEAANILKNEGVDDFIISILGEGGLKKDLQTQIDNLNLNNHIRLLGFYKNPYPYIDQADICVVSSDHEGLPTVVCEALTLNKPIVSSNVTGSTELLENGNLGILVDKDAKSLAKGLKELIQKPELRQKMQEKLTETKFSFEKENIMPKIEKLLLNI